jgi:uncharacterized membrane-anchored protein YhcB (DUF1043 family)
MSDKNKLILTWVSAGIVVGVIGAVIVKRISNKDKYGATQKNSALDAEMETLFRKIKEAKK